MGPIRNDAQRLYAAACRLTVHLRRVLHRLPNGHLHLGLIGALVASSLIAIAIPISRSQANEPLAPPPLMVEKSADAFLEQERYVAHPGAAMQRTTPVAFTLHEDGLTSNVATLQLAVGAALAELGMPLNDADIVTPARDAELSPGTHVYVQRARRIELVLGASEMPIFTQEETVGEALASAGHALEPGDRAFPAATTLVRDGMFVRVVTVRDVERVEDERLAYGTTYREDPQLATGQRWAVQAGADGYVRRTWRVHEVNGQETARQLLSETRTPPTDAVVLVGTSVPPPTTAPDGSQCTQTMSVWSTYYTAASAGGNTTRTGTSVSKGIVAVDPRVIPLGTRMYIPGYGYGLAADTGGGVKGAWIDVAYGAGDAIDWYSHYVDICILG